MPGDAEVIASLLSLEQALSFAYRHVPRVTPMLDVFGRQEREHARLLGDAGRKLGAAAPPPGAEALARLHVPKIADARTETEVLEFLLELEDVAVGAYFVAVRQLGDPALVRMAAQIMANEAQHVALLRQRRLHGDPTKVVPNAFVEGKH